MSSRMGRARLLRAALVKGNKNRTTMNYLTQSRVVCRRHASLRLPTPVLMEGPFPELFGVRMRHDIKGSPLSGGRQRPYLPELLLVVRNGQSPGRQAMNTGQTENNSKREHATKPSPLAKSKHCHGSRRAPRDRFNTAVFVWVLTVLVAAAQPRLEPLRTGRWPEFTYGAAAHDVKVVGKYAYVAMGYGGLAVIDVSNPTNCVRVGGWDTEGWGYSVAVVGNYATSPMMMRVCR